MALYMSFFPQLVAGPIVRAAISCRSSPGPIGRADPGRRGAPADPRRHVQEGDHRQLSGDGLVDPVFAAPDNYGGPDLLLATYGYAVQIYCDFSAYTDIAIGVAALLRVPLSAQFQPALPGAAPAGNSGSAGTSRCRTWLRDYLYKPLGGNRHGGSAPTAT
jgi:alginate O-acetyltransferase complex protein AlgI